MRRRVFLAALLLSSPATAAVQFDCGGARAVFRFTPVAGDHPGAGSPSLDVTRGQESQNFALTGDFAGGLCIADDARRPLIVYQVYCGGSGCRDLDNWGIIDPRTLAPLLVPDDGNRAAARRIIGAGFPDHIPIAEMTAVEKLPAKPR